MVFFIYEQPCNVEYYIRTPATLVSAASGAMAAMAIQL